MVANILDQLRAQSELSWDIDAPAWLTKSKSWPASELLVARNGIFHLPSIVAGQPSQLPATPTLFSTVALDYDVSLQADKPEAFFRFLSELWPNDPQSITALQEWCGYLLTPDTSQQKILFLVGPKRSGKGTLARVVRAMVGAPNVVGPTLASFSQNFGLYPLLGKSLAIVSDARLSGRADKAVVMERLLSISGEDSLTIDRKYGTAVTVKLPTRIMLLSNELPRFSDTSGALASRMIFLQLTKSFYGKEDPQLTGRLLTELPSILMWAIGGWKSLKDRGHFSQPNSTKELANEMENLGSPVGTFIRDRCELGHDYQVSRSDLHHAYLDWSSEQGKSFQADSAGFGRDLRTVIPGVQSSYPRINGERVRVYVGIRLRSGF